MSSMSNKKNTLPKGDMLFKIEKDGYTYAILTITQTYNNFFITLTDMNGKVYKKSSGGSSGLRGTKRRTHTAAEIVATNFLTEFKDDFCTIWPDMRIIVLFRTKPNIIVNTILNILIDRMPFYLFLEARKIPHNGMRKRKIRRI